MTLPPELRRAYERGRVASAALATTPICLLSLTSLCVGEPRLVSLALCCALPLAFGVARWMGRGWGRGAVIGVVASLPALLAPLCLSVAGHPCDGATCARWSGVLCVSVGALAGAVIGARVIDVPARLSALGLATLAAALGCMPFGLGVVGGAVLALGVSAAGMVAARWALA